MTQTSSGSLSSLTTVPPRSVAHALMDRVERGADREAFRAPAPGGGWRSLTWRQTGEDVTVLAAGLLALGLGPEERVALACSTRLEWVLADLAVMCAGGATTTVYPTTHADDVGFILGDAEAGLLVAEDATQVEKVRVHRGDLPLLRHVIVIDGVGDGEWVLGLDDLRALGRAHLASNPELVSERIEELGPDRLATVIYTSGTTGRPKGVQLPHRCWTYEGAAIDAVQFLHEDDIQFLWLPLAHCFGKVLLSAQLQIGFMTAIDGRVDKIVDNLAAVQPTFVAAVPRIFEKVHAAVVGQVAEHGGPRARIFDWAFGVGHRAAAIEREGGTVGGVLAAQRAIADRLVFSKIKARMGGRLRFFISGSAALSTELAEWFHAAGILILQGYGLTETSASISVNLPGTVAFATVGAPLPGTEFRVAEDGELFVRGPSVMRGYHNLPEVTATILDADGWLATGDIGEIDDMGRVSITDRKKDIVKTSNGKAIAPQAIEAQFKAMCPLASNVLVHANGRSHATALVTLDPDALTLFAAAHSLGHGTYAEWSQSDAVNIVVRKAFDDLNAKLNRWETIKDFRILEHDFTIEDGDITPSMKLRRAAVESRHRADLDSMYQA